MLTSMKPNRNVRMRPLALSTVLRTPISEPRADITSSHCPFSALRNLMAVTSTVTTAIPTSTNVLNALLNCFSVILSVSLSF